MPESVPSPVSSPESPTKRKSALLKTPAIALPKLPSPSPETPRATLLSVAPSPRLPSNSQPSPRCADRNRLFIIGAGLSRTGTDAMTAAMEILMHEPAYHGGSAVVVGGIIKEGALWLRPDGSSPELEKIFDAREDGTVYSSTFDVPGNNYVSQLMERYPNYRVILTKRRSAEEWADSVMNTVVPMNNQLRFLDKVTCGKVKPIRRALEFGDKYFPGAVAGFTSESATHDKLLQVYNDHLDKVRALVPADRLIEFNAGDGWEPLCKGLNLPVPSMPFPRKNERNGFKWRVGWASCKTFSKNHWPQLLCVVVAMLFFWTLLLLQLVRLVQV